MALGDRATTLFLALLFLSALFYETSNITRSLKPLIVSRTLGRRGFSQAFLGQKDFQWQDIRPSESLEFRSCFGDFECARLSVPLDWNSTHLGPDTNIAIAIVKKRAKVSTADPRYGGMVMLHPGGPGNSGVEFMLRKGKNFQTIIDGAQYPGLTLSAEGGREPAKLFDVISFDPRGVNNTTPTFSCFNDGIMSQTWDIQGESVGLLGSSNTSFEQIWSRSIALSQSCATHPSAFTHSDGKHIGKYINTSPVIRDMVQIIEKHGEWRERDVRNQLSSFGLTEKSEVYQSSLRRGAWRKDNEKLLYWGLSYGTFVGQAFASMQPHRVGRMVLDGVMDTDDYTRNLGETDLLDTDNVLNALITQCVEVGQENCPWASNNTSADLALQLEDLLSTLAVSPLPASGPRGPTTITESQLATMIFSNFFTPMDGFPTIAKLVSELLQANGTSFAAYKEQSLPINSQPLLKAGSWSQVPTTTAIVCGDGDSLYNLPRSSFKSRLARFRAQSPIFADVRAPFQLSCVHWPVRPAWRYDGPFGGKTAHPMLFVSQTLDPVTPLRNAKVAAAKFDGAGLIECAGVGHCSIASPSMCTAKAIGDYFQNGRLPVPGTVCEVDITPFEINETRQEKLLKRHNGGDGELWKAIISLSKV